MQWSGLGEGRAAVVGYNSEGEFFQNHPASGFFMIADAVSCGANQGRRRKRQAAGPLEPVPVNADVRNAAIGCNTRYNFDVNVLRVEADDLTDLLTECPCPQTLRQAVSDAARFVQLSQSPLCYVSTVPNCKRIPEAKGAAQVTAAQQCCYDDNG